MTISVFVLSGLLLIAAIVSAYMSLDLLPTGPGLLYALAGAVAATGAVVVFALGVVARRLDALSKLAPERYLHNHAAALAAGEHDASGRLEPPPLELEAEPPAHEPELPPVEMGAEPDGAMRFAAATEEAAPGGQDESAIDPINENRAGHLPTLSEVERVLETPEAPPALIGRYSSGGAEYMIFADGSIEAVTGEGAFKFASMSDFKRFLTERDDQTAPAR